jgi:hypothetical protein
MHQAIRLPVQGRARDRRHTPYADRIAGDRTKIGARRLVRLLGALLPVAQRAKRDLISRREFFLR